MTASSNYVKYKTMSQNTEKDRKLKNIVISGFPKSGNTWITRIVAELAGCPVCGFWNEPENNEIAKEGESRISNYRCFKSHHLLSELIQPSKLKANYVIYVVRDPRDIAISGAHYFSVYKNRVIEYVSKVLIRAKSPIIKLISNCVQAEKYRIEKMITRIIFGERSSGLGAFPTWKQHCIPFFNNQNFIIKYEDMLKHPEKECVRILQFLGFNENDKMLIKKTIYNQSFDKKKEQYKKNNDKVKERFLRCGKSEQWKSKLTTNQKERFEKYLSKELKYFSY